MPDFELGDAVPNEQIIAEIDASNEKDYLRQLKKKNSEFLIAGLSILEKERIAQWIFDRYSEVKGKHKTLSDKIDEWDRVWRMERQPVIGMSSDVPSYRMPLSTTSLEVVHANLMNVFFTPSDIGRVLPVEEGDIPKVEKLNTFMNWSANNELDLFSQVDRLFHYSAKVGESPYIMHWVKEYATEIKRTVVSNPANPTEPLYDPDTQEPIFQEREETKLVYNGPKLETFSRKDYIQPANAMMDIQPDWEMRIVRMTFNDHLKEELQGKAFAGSTREMTDWGGDDSQEKDQEDYEGDQIPVGKWTKEFLEFYGTMRINVIKTNNEDGTEELQELEEEFIARIDIESQTLSQVRKNKFPLKMRPIGLDYFVPDDEGRRAGIGVMEFMDNQQRGYDALFNQFVFGVIQSNSPIVFEEPTGNQRNAPRKLVNGFIYPTSNSQSIKIMQIPAPDQSIQVVLELINRWAQMLFGISDFSAGVESTIDPTGPAKKAELVVQQGNVRLNAIIKRKNKTLKDILKRWYLLYKENMPPNKFMRIAGAGENEFKFTPISLGDFALKSIPDFELTGNILNQNKALEAQKAVAIYQMLVANPFFNPQTQQGMQGLHGLTKWLIDKMDDLGLSRFLPATPYEQVYTPEEENARFLQGDILEPPAQEDFQQHIQVHNQFLMNPNVPDEVRQAVMEHVRKTIENIKTLLQQQAVMQQQAVQQQGIPVPQGGQPNVQQQGTAGGAPSPLSGVAQNQPAGVA